MICMVKLTASSRLSYMEKIALTDGGAWMQIFFLSINTTTFASPTEYPILHIYIDHPLISIQYVAHQKRCAPGIPACRRRIQPGVSVAATDTACRVVHFTRAALAL